MLKQLYVAVIGLGALHIHIFWAVDCIFILIPIINYELVNKKDHGSFFIQNQVHFLTSLFWQLIFEYIMTLLPLN